MTALILAAALSLPPKDTWISETAKEACIEYGEGYGISPELLMAIIEVESGGHPEAVNGTCKGLMQVSDKYHGERVRRLEIGDIFDEDGNIFVATDYLYELFRDYGDTAYVLDIYNGNSKAEYNYENGIVSEYAKKVMDRATELEVLHYGQ